MNHKALRLGLVVLVSLAGAGCPSATLLPDSDRLQVTQEYEDKVLYLRASLWVMPFFSDGSKRLVSPLFPDSIELLEDSYGKTIAPGEAESMLPMGTRVRIEKLEFPTGLAITRRPLYSPRTYPWVYLSTPIGPKGRQLVAVLRPGIKTREELLAELGELFSAEDPETSLKSYSTELRAAIREKHLLADMDSTAVALVWGRPEHIRQEYVNGTHVESWTWPLGKRSAVLRNGKLASSIPPLDQPAQ